MSDIKIRPEHLSYNLKFNDWLKSMTLEKHTMRKLQMVIEKHTAKNQLILPLVPSDCFMPVRPKTSYLIA